MDGTGAFQNFQIGQSGSGAELVGGEAVAMKECFELFVFTEKSVKYLLGCECCPHRQIAAGQALGEGHEIRLYAFAMASEQRGRGRPSSLLTHLLNHLLR